jgi:hypothetical protein
VTSRQLVVKACQPTVHRNPVLFNAPQRRDPRVHHEVAALGGVCQDGGRQHDARMIAFAFRRRLAEVLDCVAQGNELLAVDQDDRRVERR